MIIYLGGELLPVGWKYLHLRTLTYHGTPLAYKSSLKKQMITLVGIPFHVTHCFYLASFKILFFNFCHFNWNMSWYVYIWIHLNWDLLCPVPGWYQFPSLGLGCVQIINQLNILGPLSFSPSVTSKVKVCIL